MQAKLKKIELYIINSARKTFDPSSRDKSKPSLRLKTNSSIEQFLLSSSQETKALKKNRTSASRVYKRAKQKNQR